MTIIRLYEGECDGYWQPCPSPRPDVFYAVPLAAFKEIKDIADPIAKVAAFKAHSRLAYVFDGVKIDDDEARVVFRYKRCAEQDKTSDPNPAPSL